MSRQIVAIILVQVDITTNTLRSYTEYWEVKTMALFCNNGNRDCVGLATAVSVIVGITAAFLRITAIITVAPAFLWVLFGIAVIYLAVLLATAPAMRTNSRCVQRTLSALLVGILGTLLLSIVLLAVAFAATSVVGAIVVGLLLLTFSLTVTTTACLILCLVRANN